MPNNEPLRRGRRGSALALLAALALIAGCSTPPGAIATRDAPSSPLPRENTMNHRILIATTSHDRKGDTGQATGAYLPEIAHPYFVFEKAGYDVDFASVAGGHVPLDGVEDMDATTLAFHDDAALMARLHASLRSADVKTERYQAIFFAGGHGAMWDLPRDPGFLAVTAQIYEHGGVVAAVCHGPAALVDVRLASGTFLIAGKDVGGFTNEEERAVGLERVVPFLLEDRLVSRGARFVGAPKWQSQVVVSERLVTGQNPSSAKATAEAVVASLAAHPRAKRTP